MEQGKGLFQDNDGFEVKTEFTYTVINYNTFDCRSVVVNNKPTGECHIKIKIKQENVEALINKISEIDTADFGLIDPTGIINLEYPFYLKVSGIIAKETLFDTLSEIDKQLSK